MKIAIIGAGNVGSALAKKWSEANHNIVFGLRDPESSKAIQAAALVPNATILSIDEAALQADVIVITTPAQSVLTLIPLLGNVANKVIIDATNSIGNKPDPYPTAFQALKALCDKADVVKCFNSTGFENLLNPVINGVALDMFAAGSSPKAKLVAQELALAIGFANCYDFGGDEKVELLEQLAMAWINLAIIQKNGRKIAFKILNTELHF